MTTEEFIKKSKEKFPNLFTYEKTRYTKSESPIVITYNGVDFITTPHYHLRKSSKNGGCKYLSSGVNPNMNRDERLEKLIDMSKKRFGDRFSYDKISNYENNNSYLTFTCNIHGDFMTTFSNHLRKDRSSGGCPMCGKAIGGRSTNDAKKCFLFKNQKKYLVMIDLITVMFLFLVFPITIR